MQAKGIAREQYAAVWRQRGGDAHKPGFCAQFCATNFKSHKIAIHLRGLEPLTFGSVEFSQGRSCSLTQKHGQFHTFTPYLVLLQSVAFRIKSSQFFEVRREQNSTR